MMAVVVLSDGETWCTISGCSIWFITDEDFKRLCNDEVDMCKISPIVEIGLQGVSPLR